MNSLEKTLNEAWQRLEDGVGDRHSTFHLAKIGTVTLDGRPTQRTVVLRAANGIEKLLRFHTDKRSTKIAELSANPAISVIFYDPASKVQIRIDGTAQVHHDNDVSRNAWAETRSFSKACYLATEPPGSEVEAPPTAPTYDADADDIAYENFCAVTIDVTRLEWMHLASGGHKRAAYTWAKGQDTPTMSWIAP